MSAWSMKLELKESSRRIDQQVTKFGGLPVWHSDPQWPIGEVSMQPLVFIGQVALIPEIVGDIPGKMAYLFFSELPEDEPFQPRGILIVQPGRFLGPYLPLKEGPQMLAEKRPLLGLGVRLRPIEYSVSTSEIAGGAPPDEYIKSKIGGNPDWLLGPEYPTGGPWRFLFQIVADNPLQIDMGDGGIGYGFIHENGVEGRFVIQST